MSRRHSRGQREGQNLDSLLDTMANVVGILVMLVAVAQLSVGDALERITEGAAPDELTPVVVEASEAQSEEVEEAIARAQGELQAMPATAQREGMLLEAAAPLLEKLEGLAGAENVRGQDPSSWAAFVAEQGRIARKLEESLSQEQTRISKLDDLLKGVATEQRPKIARLPDPRPPPKNKSALVFLARYGRITAVDGTALVKQLEDGIQLALGRVEQGYSSEERRWMTNFFEKHKRMLGDENFYWSLQDENSKSLFAGLAWRQKESGDSLSELRLGDSKFRIDLEESSPRRRFIQFWVWPDSFEVYLEARYLAESNGFDVAWNPVEGLHPVGVQLLGPRRSRVLID